MSDEQKMPDVIYARPAGNGCGWWYPQNDDDTPYLRCDIDPDDAVVVHSERAIDPDRFDVANDRIATLTAERESMKTTNRILQEIIVELSEQHAGQ